MTNPRIQAVVDRFEGDRIILELDDGILTVNRADAPPMLAEGNVVWLENGRIVSVDTEETARREAAARRRFERLLGGK